MSNAPSPLPDRVGGATVEAAEARGLLNRVGGFAGAFDYTLNPYGGCSLGCSYCYAANFAPSPEKRRDWGRWVRIKTNAVELLERAAPRLAGRSIYMSSATEPYQPVERRVGLVRGLLEVLAALPPEQQPQLVVQTRSPLVARDADLLARLSRVRVQVTVNTDNDRARRAFEGRCPSASQRLKAARALVDAGVEVGIYMTPLLPLADPEAFAADMIATGATRFAVQPFHGGAGRFSRGTPEAAKRIAEEWAWDRAAYTRTVERLRAALPHLLEGQEAFAP